MASLVEQGGLRSVSLTSGWQYLTVPAAPSGHGLPSAAGGEWRPVTVPGIVAPVAGEDLHGRDHWFRCDTPLPGDGWIEFGGLATLAEIWIDEALVAESRTMFVPLIVPLASRGGSRLEICFRALRPALRRPPPGRRARWRGRLATEEGLRHYRTTLLGHMPGWSGDAPVIGPTGPIVLHRRIHGAPFVARADLRATLLPDGTGRITVALEGQDLASGQGLVTAAGQKARLVEIDGRSCATIDIADPPLWWPHTHGEPRTVHVEAKIAGYSIDLGRVGFRTLQRRDPASGFGLLVNGTPVFCRGAIWTGLDATACPPDPAALEAALRQMQRAGLNMLRICGLTTYADSELFRICDEIGILVWHDFMFARFDYPDNVDFNGSVRREAASFLDRVQAHPSLAVLCGGSESAQAAAMSGRPPAEWHAPLFDELLAQQAAALRPDVPYIPQSPLGAETDAIPFAASATVSHFFGVGAYQRPLDELRASGVRFASECLAFANVPEPATVRLHRGPASVPHDTGAEWDFGDVRHHYTSELFGASAPAARRQDPVAWHELGRITSALVMQQAFSIWRTDGQCAGALVLSGRDVVPGPGWGITARDGRPKSAWYALRSVCQPIQVVLRDLGQDGISVFAINETAHSRELRLRLRGLSPDGAVEELGEKSLTIEPRSIVTVTATALMGRWRDLANTWQFGPAAFIVIGATLDDLETGSRLSDSTLFPTGPALPRRELTLKVRLHGQSLEIETQGFAQFVQIDDDHQLPADNYFHLWPGERRVVELFPPAEPTAAARGMVHALNGFTPAAYGMAA